MTAVVTREDVTPGRTVPDEPIAHVAVLVSLNFPDMDESNAELVRRFTRVALDTLMELNATYEVFDTSTPLADAAAVAQCDGLLLLGGGDIDGEWYGMAPGTAPNGYGVDSQADKDAFAAIAAAENAMIPILGICRGAQLINVHRGGTILADIADFVLHRGGEGEPEFIDERILLNDGTRLRQIMGATDVVGRAGHHQAVDRVGECLVVSAQALDGIVEGIEDPNSWLIGVQWHPEDDDGSISDRLRLFGAFVDACVTHRLGTSDPDRPLSTSA